MSNILLMPVAEVGITNNFHPTKHLGTDFGWLSNAYQPIYACDDGVVVDVFSNSSVGNSIVIQHNYGNGKHRWTGYIHLHKLPNFKIGDVVLYGQQIGIMGNTGKSSGNHLHLYLSDITSERYTWTKMKNNCTINPLNFLYCDKSKIYKFASDFKPKWLQDVLVYPPSVEKDSSKHQVNINSDTRNLRRSPNGSIYPEYIKRGLYTIYDVVNAGKYKWGLIKDGFWVAIMEGDDEYLPMNLTEELKAANKKILDLTKQKEAAELKLKKIKDVLEL